MSRVTQIAIHPTDPDLPSDGLKGRHFSQPFSGCDLFVGVNGAGKSVTSILSLIAIMEGVAQVATDPRRPYFGGAPTNTSGTVTIDDCESWTRDLSAANPKTLIHKAATTRAAELVGRLPTSWNLSDFAAATKGGRGIIIDAAAKAGGLLDGWSPADCQSGVRDLLTEQEFDTTPLDQLCAAHPTGATGASWVRSGLLWTESAQKTANDDQRAAEGNWKQVKAEPLPAVEGDEKADAARRDELLLQQADARGEGDRRAQAQDRQLRSENEGMRLRAARDAQAEEGKRLAVPIPEPGQGVSDADLRAAVKVATEAVDKASALKAATAADHETAKAKADEAKSTHDAALAKVDEAARDVEVERAKLKALTALSTGDKCVHCGAADPLGISDDLEAVQGTVEQVEGILRAVSGPERIAESNKATAIRAELDAGNKVQSANTAYWPLEAARKSAVGALHGSADNRKRAIARYQEQEAQRIANLDAARKRWKSANDAVRAWETAHAEIVIPPEPEPDLDVAQTITDELAILHHREGTRLIRKQYTERLRKSAERYQELYGAWIATRQLLKALRSVRDDLAAAAYGPIEEAAQDLLRAAQDHGLPLPFFAGPDDYGAWIEGERVPFAALSESEWRITAASLVYALSVVSQQPCRIVPLDGLEVVQSDHRPHLIAALVAAQQAGKVDNVLMTCAISGDREFAEAEVSSMTMPGLTIHHPTRVVYRAPIVTTPTEPDDEQDLAADCPF